MKTASLLFIRWPHWLLFGSLVFFAGCSSFPKFGSDDDKDKKTQAADAPPALQVPAGLNRPSENQKYVPPQPAGAVQSTGTPTAAQPTSERVAPRWQGVTRMRDGQLNWLLVNATPEQTWGLVSSFLKSRGYQIARTEAAIGIMETDWKPLQDEGLDKLQAKVRVRVESYREPGRSEVFLNLKTSEAGATNVQGVEDKELAIEMQSRLAQYLGASKIDDSVPVDAAQATPGKSLEELMAEEKAKEKQKIKERWEKIEDCVLCPPR